MLEKVPETTWGAIPSELCRDFRWDRPQRGAKCMWGIQNWSLKASSCYGYCIQNLTTVATTIPEIWLAPKNANVTMPISGAG